MMKPVIPPVRDALHKALSEGCSMWAPVVPPVEKANQAADRVDSVMDGCRLPGSESDEESAATAAGINP